MTLRQCPLMLSSLALALIGVLSGSARLESAPPTVEQTLGLKPMQPGVEIDIPTKEEMAQCTVAAEKIGKDVGWVVKDGRGYVLRRFLDTNGDNRVDTWCYFHNGLEVYRDIDSNGDGKVDQFRWLATAGTRWAIDSNQDGVIDRWQQISPEELAEEAVRSLVANNPGRFQSLLLTSSELAGLGLNAETEAEIKKLLAQAGAQFAAAANKVSSLGTVKWVQFSGHRPGVVPASPDGPKTDLIVYENALAFAETDKGTVQFLLGTLIQVGSAWKLITAPQLIEDQAVLASAANLFFRPPAVAPSQPEATAGVTEEMQKLLDELEKLEAAAQNAQTLEQQAALNAKRADILEALEAQSERPEDKAMWIRQLADFVSASVQAGTFPQGGERLAALYARLSRDPAKRDLAAYVRFRQLTAEYSLALQAPGASYDAVQKKWAENLQEFLKQYPDAPDAASALMQLAIGKEYMDDVEGAKALYQEVVKRFPNAAEAPKAQGALRRLGLEGQVLEFRGKDPQGGTVDLAAYRGKVVLLHYWASWCEPCKTDMAILKDLITRYGGKLAIVGVNVDTRLEDMQAYLAEARLSWPQIYEPGGLESRPAVELGVVTLPLMILLDDQGRVVNRNVTAAELERELKRLIK